MRRSLELKGEQKGLMSVRRILLTSDEGKHIPITWEPEEERNIPIHKG